MKNVDLNNVRSQPNTNILTEKNILKPILLIISVILFCLGVTILPLGCLLSSIVMTSIGATLIIFSLLFFVLQTKNLSFSISHKQEEQIPDDRQLTPMSEHKQPVQEIVPKIQTLSKKSAKQSSTQLFKKDEQPKCRDEKIYTDFKEILSRDWRPGLDKNQLPRYVCATYAGGLFLSKRQGSLFAPLSSTPNRPFAIAVDINDPYLPEKNKLLNLIPSQFTQNTLDQLTFTNNISYPSKNFDPSSTKEPFYLICVKGLDNLPLPEKNSLISIEEQQALNETLFNLLKISYAKLLKKAIKKRVQVLQLTLLKAPFPQLNKKAKDTLSQTALLQAIREITFECRSLDLLQEIIICVPVNA